jgi:hypothetical protein
MGGVIQFGASTSKSWKLEFIISRSRFMRILSAYLVIAVALTMVVKAETVKYVKVESGGNMTWVGSETVPCWISTVKNCLRTPPPDGSFTITTYGTGYLLTTSVANMEAWHTSNPSDVRIVSSSSHTFDSSIEIRIETCSAYPSLVGTQVNLGGLSTSSSGILVVYIP